METEEFRIESDLLGHVNASQSTNDAYPCSIHLAMVLEHGILTKEQLDWILQPENMIKPVEIKL
jgi:aspartate ammonia-lyase